MAKVQNVVGSGTFGTRLNLLDLATKLPHAAFKPNRFGALLVRHARPRGTVLLFSTGRYVVNGCKSEADCLKLARIVGRQVK